MILSPADSRCLHHAIAHLTFEDIPFRPPLMKTENRCAPDPVGLTIYSILVTQGVNPLVGQNDPMGERFVSMQDAYNPEFVSAFRRLLHRRFLTCWLRLPLAICTSLWLLLYLRIMSGLLVEAHDQCWHQLLLLIHAYVCGLGCARPYTRVRTTWELDWAMVCMSRALDPPSRLLLKSAPSGAFSLRIWWLLSLPQCVA